MTPPSPVPVRCRCGTRLLVSFQPPPPGSTIATFVDRCVCPRCGESHETPSPVRQAFVEEAGRWKQFFPYGVE